MSMRSSGAISEPTPDPMPLVPIDSAHYTQRSTTMSVVPEKPRGRTMLLAGAGASVVLLLAAVLLLRRTPEEDPSPAAAPVKTAPVAAKPHAKPTDEPEELNPIESKPADAGPKKIEGKPTGKHPTAPVTATATASASAAPTAKTGKPTLDPGDPWQ
jgi:hypothetical protein